jgi:hypothetical protein
MFFILLQRLKLATKWLWTYNIEIGAMPLQLMPTQAFYEKLLRINKGLYFD